MSTSTSSTSSSYSVNSSTAGGVLRITGLNSGIDVDSVVKSMLTADQTKIDQAKQQQQLVTWKQEEYQDIISDIKDLQSTYFDVSNRSNYLLSSSNYNNTTVTSSASTTVGAKASSTATLGTYKVLVKQLAQAATITGTVSSSSSDEVNSSTKLTDLGITQGNVSIALSYGDTNSTTSTTVAFEVTDSSTVQNLMDAIKSQTGGAVTAKFNELTGEFSLQTSDTGSSSSLEIGDISSELSSKLGLSSNDTPTNGKDALVAIKEPNSDNYVVSKQSSNNFTVNGVTYSISDVNSDNSNIVETNVGGKFSTLGTNDDPTSISVAQDTSKIHDLISNFLDKYNDLVDKIQTKLTEKKDYDYPPLTDAQKAEMSDTQISNWETKAKQGILRDDNNLENLLTSLRQAFTSPVLDSSGNSVSTVYFGSVGNNALGIDTSDDYTQGSKITITDDNQFTEMLADHADEIMKLFTSSSDSTDSTENFKQSGIFERINQIISDNVGTIGTTLNSGILTKYANLQDDYSVGGGGGTGTLPDQIYTQQVLINNLTDQMNDDQTKYYNQFSALETAMQELSSQQSVISSYFS